VARAFEVNPNLLHRWRKEFRHGPGLLRLRTGTREARA
jgi:transposase-like protein